MVIFSMVIFYVFVVDNNYINTFLLGCSVCFRWRTGKVSFAGENELLRDIGRVGNFQNVGIIQMRKMC